MVMYRGVDLLRRVLCLLLIFVLAWCAIGLPMAHAVVLETAVAVYGAEIILGILAAAGVAFLSSDAGKKVSTAIWSKLETAKSSAWEKLQSLAQSFVSHQVDQTKAGIRVSEALYQEIVDAFNASYADGSFTAGETFTAISDFVAAHPKAMTVYFYAPYVESYSSGFSVSKTPDSWYRLDVSLSDSVPFVMRRWYLKGSIWNTWGGGGSSGATLSDLSDYGWYVNEKSFGFRLTYLDGASSDFQVIGFPASIGSICAEMPEKVAIPAPDLVYPSDDLLVKAPDLPAVDEETGAASWPTDIAYTKDAVTAPYPTTDDGVKVPDIPFDVPIDTTSGKSLTDTDVDNPDVPGTGEDTKTDVDWPSAGDLSLPQLIISKFPFCIPFDVARLIGLLEAEPKAPVFVVPLKYGKIMDEQITLDLSQWDDVIRIVRWGELICFVAALAVVTRNYIKW